MRKRVWIAWMLLMWLAAIPVSAQETRGNDFGNGARQGRRAAWRQREDHQHRHQRLATAGDERERLLRGSPPHRWRLRSLGRARELQELPADRHSARGRPVRSAHHHPRGRQRERTRGRGRGRGAPRHECRHVRSHLREPPADRAADVLEHAAAPGSQRLGCGGERGATVCDPGLRRRPVGAGGPGRRRRRHGVHHRWRHECRQRPQRRHLAQFRHVAGDADRNVELRCVGGTRHGARRRDDDQGGHQPIERPGRLPGVDESPERSEPLSEAHSRRATRS